MNRSYMSVLLCLFLTFYTANLSAQLTSSLSGIVKNKANESVVGATVIVEKARSGVIIKSALTDNDGKFELEKLKLDTYRVTVSFLGLEKFTSDILTLDEKTPSVFLGNIVLSEVNNQLQAATVSAKKPFVVQKIDRTVVTPDALISNAGTAALEVLEKSPGVSVDMNGNISLRGKSGVVVFIDDKPTFLAAAELANYLRSIPASNIDRIEIMTNPPAKYDAAGNAGIINIIMKKNVTTGLNGGVNLAYSQGVYYRTNNSFNFNYRFNKFNFFSNIGISQTNSFQDLTIERLYFSAPNTLSSSFTQRTFLRPEVGNQNVKLGVDFYATKNTTWGLVVSGFRNPNNRIITNDAQVTDGNRQVTGLVAAANPVEALLQNGSINVNVSHKFGAKGGELSANFDNIGYKSEMEQVLTNQLFQPNRTFISQSVLASSLPANISIRAAKVDFSKPLKMGGNFEIGAKSSFVNTSNVANFFDVNGEVRTPNYEFSNDFKYSENINAAYTNYNRDFKKFSLQLGLRMENTNIEGNQLGNVVVKDSSFKRNYTNIFPTFFLQFRADSAKHHVWGLSVGRRIDRPNYKDLNPFTYPLDRFTFYGGNPFLQPTFSANIELSHTFKSFLTTTLQYSQAENVIFETNEQRGNIFYSRPGNFATQITYGISVNGAYPLTKWWTLQLYTAYMNNTFRSRVYTENLDASRFYWVVMPTNQFVINKLWSAELAGNYQTRVIAGQFIVRPIGAVRMGLARKILKEKGSIKLNVSDVFYTNQVGGDIKSIANASANWFSFLDSRVATLSFSYRFSKGQNLRVRQSGGSESEQKRVKS